MYSLLMLLHSVAHLPNSWLFEAHPLLGSSSVLDKISIEIFSRTEQNITALVLIGRPELEQNRTLLL